MMVRSVEVDEDQVKSVKEKWAGELDVRLHGVVDDDNDD